jgi:putative ABC transport system permease protein
MFKNYLKIAFRNIIRHKGHSFINIAGLAIGMAVCILILLWIQHELSYDKFHEKADNIYRVIQERSPVTPTPLAPTLKKEIPEVIQATRYRWVGNPLIKYGEKSFSDDKLFLVDPSFFDIFSFKFLKGDPGAALKNPFSAVLTEKTAQKYFGDEDPIGKSILVDNRLLVKVTGVIENVPENSHIQFDLLGPFEFIRNLWGADINNWRWVSHRAYVLLQKNCRLPEVTGKINDMIKKYMPDTNAKFYLQPITRIHLHTEFDERERGSIAYVYIFSAAALLILLIACINFMNLATARGAARAKEVGVRKIVGAQKKDLIKQFYGESILSSIIALIIAVTLVELALPTFNALTSKHLSLDFSGNIFILSGFIFIALFAGLVSASYPSLFLSSFKPANVLRGASPTGPGAPSRLRKILVVTQFTLSIFLIISTAVVYRQLSYIKNQELGYEKDHIISMRVTGDLLKHLSAARNELLQNPNILAVTLTNTLPCRRETTHTKVNWEGKNPQEEIRVEVLKVDYNFLKTFDIPMVEGRFLSREHPTDVREGFVVNETAVKTMGFEDESPIGKRFELTGRKGKIIGVVKDFHSRSLHYKIAPLVIQHIAVDGDYDTLSFRLKAENFSSTLSFLEGVWKKYAPDYTFAFSFFDEEIDELYKSEQRMGNVFNYFTFLAIFISCLGLLGLVSFTAQQKTKEIGIRKVLGSTVPGIVLLFSRQFLIWVLAANIIAWPLGYYFMNKWLQNFAYRTGIGIDVFIISGAIALIIALLTVSYQSVKAATANPVDALRYE